MACIAEERLLMFRRVIATEASKAAVETAQFNLKVCLSPLLAAEIRHTMLPILCCCQL